MTIILEYSAAEAMCNAIVDSFDNGSAPGYMQLFRGAVPATLAETPAEATPLATITFADNESFEAANQAGDYARSRIVTGGVSDPSATGHASEDVTFARFYDADDVCRAQNDDVGTSGTQIILSSLSVPPGTEVTLGTCQFVVPFKG